jgi:hypothetical protein
MKKASLAIGPAGCLAFCITAFTIVTENVRTDRRRYIVVLSLAVDRRYQFWDTDVLFGAYLALLTHSIA